MRHMETLSPRVQRIRDAIARKEAAWIEDMHARFGLDRERLAKCAPFIGDAFEFDGPDVLVIRNMKNAIIDRLPLPGYAASFGFEIA